MLDLTACVRAIGLKFDFALPSAQQLRSIVEIRATPLDSTKKYLVARALSHSDQTAEQHYRAAEPEKKIEGFVVMGQLVGLPATLKVDPVPATRKRRKFTAEMTSLIQREIAEEIRTMRPPNKERAAAFLSQNSEIFEGKSSKDII